MEKYSGLSQLLIRAQARNEPTTWWPTHSCIPPRLKWTVYSYHEKNSDERRRIRGWVSLPVESSDLTTFSHSFSFCLGCSPVQARGLSKFFSFWTKVDRQTLNVVKMGSFFSLTDACAVTKRPNRQISWPYVELGHVVTSLEVVQHPQHVQVWPSEPRRGATLFMPQLSFLLIRLHPTLVTTLRPLAFGTGLNLPDGRSKEGSAGYVHVQASLIPWQSWIPFSKNFFMRSPLYVKEFNEDDFFSGNSRREFHFIPPHHLFRIGIRCLLFSARARSRLEPSTISSQR